MDTSKKYKMGYKVVKRYTLKSAIINFDGQIGTVRYKINEWVKPRKGCGPLCVFSYNGIDNAKLFAGFSDSIYVCLYEQSEKSKVYTNDKRDVGLDGLPFGTILASKVKLIRRINK